MAKILVVDDNFKDLDFTKKDLESQKYEVTAVTNGAAALDALQSSDFNLVILDILMPTVSGYDLQNLLRNKYNHNFPIIFLSILPSKEVDMTNIDGYIQKPYKKTSFLSEVKRIILKNTSQQTK